MSSRSTGLKDGSQMFGQKWHNKGQPQQGPKTASHKNAQNLIDPKKHGQQIADPFKNMAGKNNGKKKDAIQKRCLKSPIKGERKVAAPKTSTKWLAKQLRTNQWPTNGPPKQLKQKWSDKDWPGKK